MCFLQEKTEHRPKRDRIGQYRPQGEEFDKAYTFDYKSHTDDTETSKKQVTSEKITVSRRDMTRMEETEKPRYPKDLDIGRIVIDEIPDENEEVTQGDIVKRDEVKQRREKMETRYEIEKDSKSQVKEETIKIGKLDVTDYDRSSRMTDTITDGMQKDREVIWKLVLKVLLLQQIRKERCNISPIFSSLFFLPFCEFLRGLL